MGFKAASAKRMAGSSAIAGSVVVIPSSTGEGIVLSGSGISSSTPIQTQIVVIGQTAANSTTVTSGATGGGSDQIFYLNDRTMTASYTTTANSGVSCVGPITVPSGIILTIDNNSRLVIL